jgi:hypothetical protein
MLQKKCPEQDQTVFQGTSFSFLAYIVRPLGYVQIEERLVRKFWSFWKGFSVQKGRFQDLSGKFKYSLKTL